MIMIIIYNYNNDNNNNNEICGTFWGKNSMNKKMGF